MILAPPTPPRQTNFIGLLRSTQGTIDTGDFFEYLRWPRNAFADHLLNFMESADEDGGVDFGDFVKVKYGRNVLSCVVQP